MDFLKYNDKTMESRVIKIHENSDVLHILSTLIESEQLERNDVTENIATLSVNTSTVPEYYSLNEITDEATGRSINTTGTTIFIGIDENDNITSLTQEDLEFINGKVFIATLPVAVV